MQSLQAPFVKPQDSSRQLYLRDSGSRQLGKQVVVVVAEVGSAAEGSLHTLEQEGEQRLVLV